jgi:hypothetical protein
VPFNPRCISRVEFQRRRAADQPHPSAITDQEASPGLPLAETTDADHGRIEVRRAWVSHDLSFLKGPKTVAGDLVHATAAYSSTETRSMTPSDPRP